MRATLKTLLVTLPLSALLTVLLTFWEGANRRTRILLVVGIVAMCLGLTVQAWLANPNRRPIPLLHHQVKRRAEKLPAEAVLKNPRSDTYVYVQHVYGAITLWCFNVRWIEEMETHDLREAHIFVRGFRLDPATGRAANYYGQAQLYRNEDGTFAITPPQPYEDEWRAGPILPPQYRSLLNRTKRAISRAEKHGFWHRFHR